MASIVLELEIGQDYLVRLDGLDVLRVDPVVVAADLRNLPEGAETTIALDRRAES